MRYVGYAPLLTFLAQAHNRGPGPGPRQATAPRTPPNDGLSAETALSAVRDEPYLSRSASVGMRPLGVR